jgi:hypothetical protein
MLPSIMKNKNQTGIRFFGFNCRPEDISAQLGLEPTRTYLKGEEYHIGHPERKLSKLHEENSWQLNWTKEMDGWIQEQIEDFLKTIIEPRKDAIRKISNDCYCEFSISQHLYKDWNPGFHFTRTTLELLQYIGAEIDMDIYCFPDSQE